MPYCPKCSEDFDEGMSACVNCGADLVDSPLFASDDEGLEHFEAVFVGPIAKAFEIKSSLEDEGFTVRLQSMDESQLVSHEIADEGVLLKLLVPQESAGSAAERIKSMGELTVMKMADDMEYAPSGLADDLGNPLDLRGDFDEETDLGPVPPQPEKPAEPEPSPTSQAAKKPKKNAGKPGKKTPRRGVKTFSKNPARKADSARGRKSSKKPAPKPAKTTNRGGRKK
jgi:hypothetical protein